MLRKKRQWKQTHRTSRFVRTHIRVTMINVFSKIKEKGRASRKQKNIKKAKMEMPVF